MTEFRSSLAGLQGWEVVLWYCLTAVTIVAFAAGLAMLLRKYTSGARASGARPSGARPSGARPSGVGRSAVGYPVGRVGRSAAVVFGHLWIGRRGRAAGIGHVLVFYGFLGLLLGSAILAVRDDFATPVLHVDFLRGWFSLGFSLFLDIFGAALVLGVVIFAVIRGIVRPARLDYSRPHGLAAGVDRRGYVAGDWLFLAGLLFLALSGFLLEALRIHAAGPPLEAWSPVGSALAAGLGGIGMPPEAAESLHHGLWWLHGVAALAFLAAIPFTKAVHLLTGPIAVTAAGTDRGRTMPAVLPGSAMPGYSTLLDFSWQHLVDLDACTRCGKCHVACPATAAGHPLSPRDLVLDLREMADGALGIRRVLGIGRTHGPQRGDAIVPGAIRPETVWSCTNCLACSEICPVGVEHVPIINQVRRSLVEAGTLDARLQGTLEKISAVGNSFGEARRKRTRWTRDLPFEVKDIRSEPAEYLWFLGDHASFDARNQRATRALATLLHAAGVDFGILCDAEQNAGCDVRRVGEEGLFAALAEENTRRISACSFTSILTSDPHSYHALESDYPSFGGSWTVIHHTELLQQLLASGRLTVARTLEATATYHDPCMLGRYNGILEAPREVLRAIGLDLREMPRNRDNSFCCGAGGGRIWMKEMLPPGGRRAAEQRIDEAIGIGPVELFVVACPKDVVMFEDAIKTSGHEGRIVLREISELVLEAVTPAALPGPGAR